MRKPTPILDTRERVAHHRKKIRSDPIKQIKAKLKIESALQDTTRRKNKMQLCINSKQLILMVAMESQLSLNNQVVTTTAAALV